MVIGVFFAVLLGVGVALTEGIFGLYVGLVAGPLISLAFSGKERWELDGDRLRQVKPRRLAQEGCLSVVHSLKAQPRLKGGVDLTACGPGYHEFRLPTGTGPEADAFRARVTAKLPPQVLATTHDPQVREILKLS